MRICRVVQAATMFKVKIYEPAARFATLPCARFRPARVMENRTIRPRSEREKNNDNNKLGLLSASSAGCTVNSQVSGPCKPTHTHTARANLCFSSSFCAFCCLFCASGCYIMAHCKRRCSKKNELFAQASLPLGARVCGVRGMRG